VRKAVAGLPEIKAFIVPNTCEVIQEGRKTALKNVDMMIKGLGIEPVGYTPSGLPSADYAALKALVGNVENEDYGKMYDHFKLLGQEEKGIEVLYILY